MLASGSHYAFFCFLSALLSGAVGAYSLRRRVPGALAFGISALSQSFWTLGYVAELSTDSFEGKLFWDNLQFVGTAGWVLAFFTFASEYTNRSLGRHRLTWALHASIVGPYLGLVVFAPLHPWLRPWAGLAKHGDSWVLEYPFTPYTWVLFGYMLLLFGASIGYLLRQALRASSTYRAQNFIVIAGVAVPVVGITLTMLGVSFGAHRDTTPITFGVSNLLVGWGMFRHQLFDLVPIARDLVVENLRAGVVVLDEEGRVVDLNPSARQRLAREPERAIGRPASVALGSWAPLFRGMSESGQRSVVVTDPAQAGDYFELSVAAVRDGAGIVRGQVLVAHDVSELKRAEHELRKQNLQLEAVNRELDSFSYSVSHDLRAPLRAIEGFARILREENGATLDDRGRRHLGFIDGGVKRMQEVVSALLNLARVSRRTLERESVSIAELTRDVVADLEPELSGRDVDLIVMDLPPCSADPVLVRQVLANLLGNAVKFSRDRSPARIEVGHVPGAEQPTYFVKDNGVGFDMEHADRLFGAFQRLHDSGEFEGSGVGLATVSRIVNRHGGRVWAEAEPGQGATLYFTLGS